jgi:hypothetical protein
MFTSEVYEKESCVTHAGVWVEATPSNSGMAMLVDGSGHTIYPTEPVPSIKLNMENKVRTSGYHPIESVSRREWSDNSYSVRSDISYSSIRKKYH